MSAIKHIPGKEHLIELKADIDRLLMRKMNESSDMWLINQVVDHNVAVYAHIEKLEQMIVNLQERLLLAKSIYDDLLAQYSSQSDRELKMIKWILKKKNNDRPDHKG